MFLTCCQGNIEPSIGKVIDVKFVYGHRSQTADRKSQAVFLFHVRQDEMVVCCVYGMLVGREWDVGIPPSTYFFILLLLLFYFYAFLFLLSYFGFGVPLHVLRAIMGSAWKKKVLSHFPYRNWVKGAWVRWIGSQMSLGVLTRHTYTHTYTRTHIT